MNADTAPSVAVVLGYLDAYTRNDIAAAATHLADTFEFDGPFAHYSTAAEFIGDDTGPGLTAWAKNLTGYTMIACQADGEQVLAMYDVRTRAFGTLRTASHFTVHNGRIHSEKIIFDPTPIHRARTGTPSPTPPNP
ncbi:MAG: nuclear transport factor 2 family protein [Mycobacteriales bacterium]